MRAVVVRGRGVLAVERVADPTPQAAQVVLRVEACGICGSDVRMHREGILAPGSVMGHEFSGEVAESRAGWKVGELVCALPVLSCGGCERCRSGLGAFCEKQRSLGLGAAPGALAEYVAVAAHEVLRLPEEVDRAHGALVEPLAAGLHAVNVSRLRRGESCLVIGGGPIGLAVGLWARHFGAEPVIVSEVLAARRAIAEQLGATAVVDPGRETLTERLAGLVPGGPDVVFEVAGTPGRLEEAISAVRFRGRVVVAGVHLGPGSGRSLPAVVKEVTVQLALAYEKDDFQYSLDMMQRGRIAPGALVTDRVGLDAVPAAFDALVHPERECKVLVLPDG